MRKSQSVKMAFALNMFVMLMGFTAGFRYIFSSQLMQYHLDAMSVSAYSSINPDYHVMFMTFLRVAGLGMTTASTAMGIILFNAFRKGENWSRWGILVIFIVHFGPLQLNMINLALNTPASPPYFLNFVAIILALTAFFLSRNISSETVKQNQ